jgi:hypothetical protein
VGKIGAARSGLTPVHHLHSFEVTVSYGIDRNLTESFEIGWIFVSHNRLATREL